jgi:predicted pyridoxine 5'-phosphate oxidase superfamily flavin-nucleotide-binding protein
MGQGVSRSPAVKNAICIVLSRTGRIKGWKNPNRQEKWAASRGRDSHPRRFILTGCSDLLFITEHAAAGGGGKSPPVFQNGGEH